MKHGVTHAPAPRPTGEAAPPAEPPAARGEATFPLLGISLWVWLAGFALLVAELILQALAPPIVNFFYGIFGH